MTPREKQLLFFKCVHKISLILCVLLVIVMLFYVVAYNILLMLQEIGSYFVLLFGLCLFTQIWIKMVLDSRENVGLTDIDVEYILKLKDLLLSFSILSSVMVFISTITKSLN